MKTPLGTEVDLGPGHIVLDGDPAPSAKGAQQPPPSFRPMSIVATVAHLTTAKLLLTVVMLNAGHSYSRPYTRFRTRRITTYVESVYCYGRSSTMCPSAGLSGLSVGLSRS